MKRTLLVLSCLMVAGLALAISFTDTDKAKNHGKTGLKNLTSEIDANFAQIEAGQFVQSTDTNSAGVKVQSGTIAGDGQTLKTNTFETVFSAAPVVLCSYAADPGDVAPIYISSVDSNVVVIKAAVTNIAVNWIAIGL